MYFPLEINEQLANAMRAAAEAKAEIGIFKKQEETRSEKRVCLEPVEELGDILCALWKEYQYQSRLIKTRTPGYPSRTTGRNSNFMLSYQLLYQ